MACALYPFVRVCINDNVRCQVVMMTDQQKLETIRSRFCERVAEALQQDAEDKISRIRSIQIPSYYPAPAIAKDIVTMQAIVHPPLPDVVVNYGEFGKELAKLISVKQAQMIAICTALVATCIKMQANKS